MEEKNRYIYIKIDGYYWIKDIETNENYCVDKKIVNLLNQQDKEIKTLKTKFEERKKFCISQVKCQQDLIYKLLEDNQQLKEENGYIIFVDGYDENGNEIHKQKFIKYKDKFKELVEENKQLKEHIKDLELLLNADKKMKTNSLNGFEKLRQKYQQLKQSQNQKENEILKKIVDFINELAWQDVKYDAFQSTMGEFPASPSAIPRYAKKYLDLWKEMFNENLEDKIKNWEQNNGRIYKK